MKDPNIESITTLPFANGSGVNDIAIANLVSVRTKISELQKSKDQLETRLNFYQQKLGPIQQPPQKLSR